ncbi:MAG: ATP-binding cassette domain-containing protein [Luteococcus sp.]|uniref:energy-coupling factor ABC transporter ATP-binding protein n=1 Tax=Luteococcus sp. TaxID=1969402 RepID=UPI0026489C7A|nr:ATP-binding cassette domain-containing protein [Luteococcus sp.]MDN5563136.1 ATP-binding cassette domain-containing protein [Luteococcus sp.]
MAEALVLRATGLHAGYLGQEVLRGAGLELPTGCRLALLGANGSGKTTLLRCLSGAHRPSSGTVEVAGNRLGSGRGALREHRRRVQLVLQDPDDQLFSADVSQDVSFGPMNLGLPPDEVRARVRESLALLGVSHLAERPTHQLSYGERKRVATAGAVAMRPEVLLLDEPTAGLDPAGVHEMLAALERLIAQGTTVVLATHDVDLALAWGEQAAVVLDGTVRQGPVTDILADQTLLAAARLHRPWPLELAARLGLGVAPRHLDDIVTALTTPQ